MDPMECSDIEHEQTHTVGGKQYPCGDCLLIEESEYEDRLFEEWRDSRFE